MDWVYIICPEAAGTSFEEKEAIYPERNENSFLSGFFYWGHRTGVIPWHRCAVTGGGLRSGLQARRMFPANSPARSSSFRAVVPMADGKILKPMRSLSPGHQATALSEGQRPDEVIALPSEIRQKASGHYFHWKIDTIQYKIETLYQHSMGLSPVRREAPLLPQAKESFYGKS